MSRRGFLESLQVLKKAFYARAVLGFVWFFDTAVRTWLFSFTRDKLQLRKLLHESQRIDHSACDHFQLAQTRSTFTKFKRQNQEKEEKGFH